MKRVINLMLITTACLMSGALQAQTDFTFTGEEQTYVVPNGVSGIQIEAWGAQGGGSEGDGIANQDDGGLGGYAKGTLIVNNGDELKIYVGGKPTLISGGENIGGFNGGGAAGRYGGAGGGASDVRMGGNGLFNRIIVAAGGGGGNTGNPDLGAGGAGGGLIGENGFSSLGFSEPTGGTQSIGGTGAGTGTNGTLGNGGTFISGNSDKVAGGGGGLFGGGAASVVSGGAGGSSFFGNLIDSSTVSGVRSSNGLVRITEVLSNAVGSITAGNAEYRYSGFGSITQLRVNGQGVLFKDWWHYRITGDNREFEFPIPDFKTIFDGNRATLIWLDVGGRGLFSAQLSQVIGQPNAAGATLINTFRVTNLTNQAMQFDMFHFVDIDIAGSANDEATLLSGNNYISLIDNTTSNATNTAEVRAGGNLAYQAGGNQTIETLLTNDTITALNDSGLPFDPVGDFTGAFQWSEFIPASASLFIESTLAAGTATAPEPAQPVILDFLFDNGFESN
jgi:hypothetical protein